MEFDDRQELPAAHIPEGPYLFVSYASVDRQRVLAVADGLRGAGLELWIDQAGIAGGAAYGTEIANALKSSAAVALMCSAASLESRNVRQEIMLAWRYDRPILPLLLEPTTFPDDVAYWLEGAQWIEVLDAPPAIWLPLVGRALGRHGLNLAMPTPDRAAAVSAGQPVAPAIAGHLPTPDGALIGRDREVGEVLSLLGQAHWVTLNGTGGTGKTRLALEVARRLAVDLPGGAWFVDLAPVSDAKQILPAVASALDLAEQPGRDWRDVLAERIGDERMLLVLDNVEQVADGAVTVSQLAEQCAELIVLATSRAPLGVPGEWAYAVHPFALPDVQALPPLPVLARNAAVQLFVERAKAAKPDFVLTDGLAQPVAEICHRLDGLPLAIELAAARVRFLTPAAILTRLGSRLNLLTRGLATNARQQTLRDTIAWSFDLLSPSEQATFRRLAVFRGGALVSAAESVIAALNGDGIAALDDITSLVDHSLMRVEHLDADGDPRVRMLETIREYAAELLDASDEQDAVRSAHAAAFLDLAARTEPEFINPRPGPIVARLRAEDDNFRAALDWLGGQTGSDLGCTELRLATGLVNYWRRIGRYQEAESRLDQAMQHCPQPEPAIRAAALVGLGFVAARRGDSTAAIERFQETVAIRRTIGDRAGEAKTLQYLAELAEERGDFAQVEALRQEVLAIWQALGNQTEIASALHDLGVTALYRGEFAMAIERFHQALPEIRRGADARNLAIALNDLTAAEMLSGQGDAVRHAAEGLALWRALDDRFATFQAMLTHGRALQLAGRHDEAIPVFEAGYAEAREFGESAGISLALYGLGLCALTSGDLDAARDRLSESLRISHESGSNWHVAERLEALAALGVMRGEGTRPAHWLGAAANLRDTGGFPVPPAEQPDIERTHSRLTETLGAVRLAAAMNTGRETSLDAIVADALRAATIDDRSRS